MTIYKMSLQNIIDHYGSCYGVLCKDCPFSHRSACHPASRGPHCAGYRRELLENAKLELIKLEIEDMLKGKR